MISYDVVSGAGRFDEVSAASNLTASAASVLASHEALAGREVRVVHHGDQQRLAALYSPEGGWVVDDSDLGLAFEAHRSTSTAIKTALTTWVWMPKGSAAQSS